jgi:acyl carrier protein
MKERIIDVISRTMEVPAESLSAASSPATVEKWDSLKHMNMVLALEEEFGIRLNDERIMKMVTVGAIVETVSELAPA